MNRDPDKVKCPECGGECKKRATVYFTKYRVSTGEIELYADRICSDCACEWTLLEDSWQSYDVPEPKDH